MIQVARLLALPRFRVGVVLVGLFWSLNWLLPHSLYPTAYLFFPLWLGYVLVVDALVWVRRGSSMLSRSGSGFVWLFAGSAPAWWLFELINARTQNWEYPGAEVFGPVAYFALCTVAFSTVMPAVFGTADLVRSFGWVDRLKGGPRLRPTRVLTLGMFLAGASMLVATLAWPRVCYPFVWGAMFLILEPINVLTRRAHLFRWLERGDWRPVVSLALGSLICGFFWEMWNFYSYPRWIYHTPGVEFFYLFEMPLLGYLGYMPFAWELFSLRNLILPRAEAPDF